MLFFPPSSSYSSTSKWRKLPKPAVHHLLQVWSAPLLSWVELDLARQMSLCPLPRQEACPSPLSHLVPRVPPICPLRCPCPPCQWGRLLLTALQCLIIDPLLMISWLLSFMVCSHTALPVYSVHVHLDTAGTFSLLISTNDVIIWSIFIYLFGLCKCAGQPMWPHCFV